MSPEIEVTEPAIVLNINQLYREDMSSDEIYEVASGNWKVNRSRSEKAQYAIVVYKSVIKDVYKIDEWTQAEERWAGDGAEQRSSFIAVKAQNLQHYID